MVDDDLAIDGAELTLIWGDEGSIGVKPQVEPHRETAVRVKLSTTQLGSRFDM